MDIINGPIRPFITFFVFFLAITNAAASFHSANIRGHLASYIQLDKDAADLVPSSFTLPSTTNTNIETDVVVRQERHDQGNEQPLTVAATSTKASKPCIPRTKTKTNTGGAITTFKANVNWVPLPTRLPASPPSPSTTTSTSTTTKQQPAPAPTNTPASSSSSFNPQASCMLAIFSLISNIPTPGPALSTALEKAKHALAPSAVAAPSCTITLPASLSSEYGEYTSRVNSWVSQHSKALDQLDGVCDGEETFMQTARMSVYKRGRIRATGGEMGIGKSMTDVVHGTTTAAAAAGQGQSCTAPVAVFTGVTSAGSATGGGNTTAKATSTKSGTGVGTSTKTGTVTTTTATTTSTSSITGSATTVAVVTSSQPVEGSKVGGAARVTGVMTAAMVVAGFLAVVIAM